MAANLDDISLQFQQSAYADAISQLQSKLSELDELASQYQDRKDQISQFWTDSNAEQAKATLTESIQKVYTARKAVADALKGIQSGDSGFSSSNTSIQSTLAEQKATIDKLFGGNIDT